MKTVGRSAAPNDQSELLEKFPADDQLPKTPTELKAALRYQFTSALFDESYPAGWFPVFARICCDIDSLGAAELGFRWVQLKEKFGAARWYCSFVGARSRADRDDQKALQVRVATAIREAAERTSSMCMVCGEPGKLDQSRGWVLTLCEKHAQERAQNGGAYPKCDLPPGPSFDEELAAALEKSGRKIRFLKAEELLDAVGGIDYDEAPLYVALEKPAAAFIRDPEMTSDQLIHEYRWAILEFMPFGDLSIDAAETAQRLFYEFNVRPACLPASRAKKSQDDGSVVLFLDIDGVLHPERPWLTEQFSCLEAFEEAVRPYVHVDIVISGSTRLSVGLDRIRARFSPGIASQIVGVTPDLSEKGTTPDSRLERVVWMAKNRSATPAQEGRCIAVVNGRASLCETSSDQVLVVLPSLGFTAEDGTLLKGMIEVKLKEGRASGGRRD